MVAASPARQFLTEAVAERDLAFPGITRPMTVDFPYCTFRARVCSSLGLACYALCQLLGLRCEK
jgi:hypothetical protein